jgi:non-homologous end joining protein Ku
VHLSQEIQLGSGLIKKLSSENFDKSYNDEYRNCVLAMIDEKIKGCEITVPPRAPAPGRVIDLMAALRESMKTARRGDKRAEQTKQKKAWPPIVSRGIFATKHPPTNFESQISRGKHEHDIYDSSEWT